MEDWDKFSMEESFAINTPLPLSKTELLVSGMTIDNFSYRMKKTPQCQQKVSLSSWGHKPAM